MTPESLLDTAYRFFGDAAITSMVTFLLTRFVLTTPGAIVATLVKALQDGKVTSDELAELKQLISQE